MSRLIDMSSRKPHVVVDASDFGDGVHVFPLEYFERWARGEPVDRPSDAVLRAIVGDYVVIMKEDLDGRRTKG